MSGKFFRYLIVALAALCSTSTAQDQDTTYTLTFYAGGGYTRNFSTFDPPIPGLNLRPQRNGVGGFVRVMWKPEHLLRVGLETGVAEVYSIQTKGAQTSFGPTDYSSFLNVIPVSLIFSMHLTKRLEGYIGSTSFLLFSSTRSFGNKVTGWMLSIGFSAALTYMWQIDEDWGIGAELKWYHIEKSRDDNASVHVVLSYRFLEW